jgi:hypothetical protein
MLDHEKTILRLCRAIKRPSCFHEVLAAEELVTDKAIKEEIHAIGVRLYHYEEGSTI